MPFPINAVNHRNLASVVGVAIKMYIPHRSLRVMTQFYKRCTWRPLCPVHETVIVEVSPAPVRSNRSPQDVQSVFTCQSQHCELFWAGEHEHFELLPGRPVYTNADPSCRMRCLVRNHGCLYLAAIHPTHLWTWKGSICDYAYTDGSGGSVNPPHLVVMFATSGQRKPAIWA